MPKKVALIIADWPVYEKYCPNFVGMQDGLEKLGIEYRVFSCRPTLEVDTLIDYQPDFVLYGLLDMVKRQDWRIDIRDRLPAAKIVMWYGDLRDSSTGQIGANMREIDMMFVSNNAQNGYYEKKWAVPACHFMPLGSPIYETEYDPKYDFPFVFIGGKMAGQRFLDRAAVIQEYEDKLGLKVIDAVANSAPTLRAKIMKAMPSIYASSRASLDMSHFTDIDRYTSNRYWIIGASSGAAVTKRFPGCTDFYPEDSRAYFDTFEEAEVLVKKLQNDEGFRDHLKMRALEEAQKHTYDHRFREIFKLVYGN